MVAFATAEPETGYCQGLNSVAATLLLLMGEEEAFWALLQLLRCCLPVAPSFRARMGSRAARCLKVKGNRSPKEA